MNTSLPRTLHLADKSDRGESGWIIGIHKRGCKVHVCGRADSPYVQAMMEAGITVTDMPLEKKIDRAALKKIREICTTENIDIVHSGNGRTTQHMVMATRKLYKQGRSPKLVAYLGVIGNVAWWSPISWVRFLNPRIDRIITVAEGVRRYLLEDVRLWGLKLDPEKVVTIHKGHRLEWYQEPPADLAEFDIPQDAMVVTVACRPRPRKGLQELVKALGETDPAKNIHVLMLGHTGNDELKALIDALPHPERVHLGGFRKDAPRIMAASDVCCLPVLWGEGLSRQVIEGMAYAVCPLVTAVSGNTELVIDGECGLVVDPGDVPALAEAMEYLYDHPQQRRQMGAAARERIEAHFHNDRTVDETLALYQTLMNE